jgi:tetratricopeptide (TPR) repeat protein
LKKAREKIERLKTKTSEDLEILRAKLEATKNIEELIRNLNEINDYSEKKTVEFIQLENIELVQHLQEKVVPLFEIAGKIIENPSFSEFSTVQQFISSKSNYWQSRDLTVKEDIAEKYRKKGCESREKGEYKESLVYFNKALELRPENAANWFERGSAYYEMGDFTAAIRDYDRVLEIDPGNPNALCNIGLSLYYLDRYNDSLHYFEEAISINPVHVTALVGLGNSYFRLDKYDKAREKVEIALSLEPNSVFANQAMASLLHDGFRNFKEAKKHAEAVIEYDKNNFAGKANLAEIYLASDDYQDYNKSVRYSGEVLDATHDLYGYPMRLVKLCALYFSKKTEEAAEAALDLINYYKAIQGNVGSAWKFRGLKQIIKNKLEKNQISRDAYNILHDFIKLFETTDDATKNYIIKNLPDKIKSANLATGIPEKIAVGTVDFFGGILNRVRKPERILKPRTEKEILIKNTSKPDPKRQGYYNWAIFLEPEEALNQVDKVEYTLHKTFPKPIRTTNDRKNKFVLESSGWGEFQVKVKIYFKNKTEPLVKYHWLKLGYSSS